MIFNVKENEQNNVENILSFAISAHKKADTQPNTRLRAFCCMQR